VYTASSGGSNNWIWRDCALALSGTDTHLVDGLVISHDAC
jgi:hypothetical protein